MRDVVKCTVMLADIAEWATFNEVYKAYFRAALSGAQRAVRHERVAMGARVEVECLAVRELTTARSAAARP